MDAVSRREEDNLLKSTKAKAMKECDSLVREFAECATGRLVSVAWACRDQHKALQACIYSYTNPDSMAKVRAEYLRLRNTAPSETSTTS
ncbi:hypothetical protein DL93DRAFT_2081021 [Clavulina sp. PMI_390]|nr:hypothetical protein DL93DRAFT_2081021 [Clavulina sp. PMI_390]